MPDLTKTVEIILQGTDNISATLTKAGRNMDRFGDDLQDIGQPFSDVSDKVALLNTAIAGLAIAGLKASSDIESQAQKMKNSLGLPTEEAKKFKDVALDVYSTGYVDNLADAFDVVTAAQKKFGDNASVDIGKVSEQALALQKTFGTDFNESIAAVGTLMSDFGITSEEAFNFITAGFQEGLNGSDDFLESITEYSTQFKNGGADAGEFFSVLSSGFQDGVLGTDKAADMFKEFRVRIQDESKSTNEALQSLGIDPEEFGENMASGKTTAAEAFSFIQERLNETQDKTVQFNAGVALMGTQFEDMGTAAALAVKTTSVNLDDLQGKIDSIDTRTFAEKFQALTNTITSQFGNMERWEVAKEKIGVVFEDIAASFGPALKNVDFSGLEESAEQVWNKISNIFKNNDIDLTTVHGMENAVQLVIDSVESLADITGGMVDVFGTVFTAVKKAIDIVNDLPPGVKELAGEVIAIGSALTTLGGIVVAGGGLLSGLGTLAGFFGVSGGLGRGLTSTIQLLSGTGGLGSVLSGLPSKISTASSKVSAFSTQLSGLKNIGAISIAFGIGWKIGDVIRDKLDLDEPIQEAIRWIDKKINFTGTMGEVDLGFDKEQKEELKSEVEAVFDEIGDVEVKVEADATEIDAVNEKIEEIPAKKEMGVELAGEADKQLESIKQSLDEIDDTDVNINTDVTEVDEVKEAIATIPTEKEMEMRLAGELDQQLEALKQNAALALKEVETRAQNVQTAMEWKGKVDIANAEASARKVEAAFNAATTSVVELTQSTTTMFGGLLDSWDKLSNADQGDFMDILEDQQDAQNKALDAQTKLTKAQTDYMNKKTQMMDSGQGLIQIDSVGLEPELELVMWKVIEKVQIKATEEAANLLLALPDASA